MLHVRCLRVLLLPSLGCLVAGLIIGCGKSGDQAGKNEAPAVPVATPVARDVTDFADFTGRLDPSEAVDIRARVTGFLENMPFREGAMVQKDDLLFEIDPRPYVAQLGYQKAQIEINKAAVTLAEKTLESDIEANRGGSKAVTELTVAQDRAALDQARARLEASRKNLDVYELNVEFTKVRSPIDGQISRYYYTKGNLIIQDQTLLTTVVAIDPMFAYFDMDEATLLRIRRSINEGRIKRPDHRWWDTAKFPVYMALQGETGYPHQGTINFINNQVNPSTGSISVRGRFDNPQPPGGTRLLSPGMFVRVRLPLGQPINSLLVIDRAIVSDQGRKYVYVLNPSDNKVEYRRVFTGALQEDGLRVVERYAETTGPDGKVTRTGIKDDDLIVVGALQSVRPNQVIRPDKQANMPSFTSGTR
jgi:multidrug efflux system membrane fusion protein